MASESESQCLTLHKLQGRPPRSGQPLRGHLAVQYLTSLDSHLTVGKMINGVGFELKVVIEAIQFGKVHALCEEPVLFCVVSCVLIVIDQF